MHIRNPILYQRGYRSTPQRYLILHVIQEAHEHLSVEQITKRVQEKNPYVSISTIYRTLELLQELGLVSMFHFPGQQPCYEAIDDKTHHHLVCQGCHTVLHLEQALLGTLHERLEEQYHFHGLRLDLLASGYCERCWKTRQENEPAKKDVTTDCLNNPI
ncbi:MAG TPA: transcriptional repressor [Ktedonobacteraceae bacterium]|jgi:Fe2+ or Zn2+ uptake regulation protein|nr:transcriptional repressor [Ktedonobacteraceae bacterium]